METQQNPQISRFCWQFLQLDPVLDFPDGELLRDAETQECLFDTLFAEDALAHPPPVRFQLRVLKEIIARIESSIVDWEQHVRDSI